MQNTKPAETWAALKSKWLSVAFPHCCTLSCILINSQECCTGLMWSRLQKPRQHTCYVLVIYTRYSGNSSLGHLHQGDASPGPGWQNAHIIFVIITSIKGTPLLRTYARKSSNIDFFIKLLLQLGYELFVSEMQKMRGHRLRFQDKISERRP